MIIYSRTSGTFLLFRTTQAFHISIIIIRPDNGHIIRKFQPLIVYIEHFFIWSKGLRNVFRTLTDGIYQHLPLCHQRFLKHIFSIGHIIACIHCPIVQSTQSQSIYIFKRSTFFYARFQDFVDTILIIDIIPFAHFITFPFACCIKQ